MIGLIAESQQGPACGKNQRFPVHAVDTGVATVPAAAGAHTIVEQSDSQSPPTRDLWRELRGERGRQTGSESQKREGCWFNPAGGAGCPSPAAELVVVRFMFRGTKGLQELLPAA